MAECERLQNDLFIFQKWVKDWQMEFNPTKCEHLQITNKHSFIDAHYTLYGHTLQSSYLMLNI